MRRKILTVVLTIVMTLSMSFTALAAGGSSNTGNNSSNNSSDEPQKPSVSTVNPGDEIAPETVKVAIKNPATGTVSNVTLKEVTQNTQKDIIAAATSDTQLVATVTNLISMPTSDFFRATIASVAVQKGTSMVVNNMGTVKTEYSAKDAMGNTIVTAGKIKNVTKECLILLMGVNADGTIEYTEGVIDPVNGKVVGAFKKVPMAITVMVIA